VTVTLYIISAVLAWLRAGEIIYNVPVVEILNVRWRIVKGFWDHAISPRRCEPPT